MGIRDEDVQRVRDATDLVELAREHLALKRVGRRWVGLCPFHSEKSGSFSINPELNVYHCFGCQASGDAITFVREVEHLDFVGAVERLAARAGITLQYDDPSQSKERGRKQRLHEVVEAAIAFYHERLLTSGDAGRARQYVRSRSFDRDAVVQFRLGYSPGGWDELSRALQQQKFSRDDIVSAGLAFVNRAQKLQDVFRDRLMFPIWDQRGDAVGFGARTLGDEGPKYKNTAETPLYQKSKLLYGLNLAKGDIVARGEVVICEGYTDVMAFHLAGVPTAVATCGTALADEHFMALKNLARRIVLAYDADAAGQAAAERCYQWEQRYEVQFQVADLPTGRDPGDLWKDDREALPKAIEQAVPFLEFRIDRAVHQGDRSSIEGRARVAQAAAAIIAEHPSELVRDQYAVRLGEQLGIDAERIRAAVADQRRGVRRPLAPATAVRQERPVDRLELDVLRWAVHRAAAIGPYLHVSLFHDPRARATFAALAGAATVDEAIRAADEPVAGLLRRLVVEEPEADDGDDASAVRRAVVNLVAQSSDRWKRSMLDQDPEVLMQFNSLRDALANARRASDWVAALGIAEQLVGWIAQSAAAATSHDTAPDDEFDGEDGRD